MPRSRPPQFDESGSDTDGADVRQTLVSLWATLVHQALRDGRGAERKGHDHELSQDQTDASGAPRRCLLAPVDDEAGSRASRVDAASVRTEPAGDGPRLAV